MTFKTNNKLGCSLCQDLPGLGFDIEMAFQPIVNIETKSIYSYESLVRGKNGESAWSLISQLTDENKYQFDQLCRVKSIEAAALLGIDTYLNINFMPNAVYKPETCIRMTLEAAEVHGFPLDKIIFEVTETEEVFNIPHLQHIIDYYRKCGFITALDDFGSAFANLDLLAQLNVDLVKIDIVLVRNVHKHKKQKLIVESMIKMAQQLGLQIIVEGVESVEELEVFRQMGVTLFQGFYFAKPGFKCLPKVDWHSI